MKHKQKNLSGKMSVFIFLLFYLVSPRSVIAQKESPIWKDVQETPAMRSVSRLVGPDHYRTVSLNEDQLKSLLRQAPLEFDNNVNSRSSRVVLSIPFPDGSMREFSIVESPVMEDGLAVQFPEIKTYNAQAVNDPLMTMRFGWTYLGFHAIIITGDDWVIIEPYEKGQLGKYIVYYKKDVHIPDSWTLNEDGIGAPNRTTTFHGMARVASGASLRTYRLAVSSTGEFYASNGGTNASVLSAIVTIVNQDDAIYEREVAVRFVLVANNNKLLFSNATTDPFTNTSTFPCGTSIRSENQTACDDSIGNANYDIGHVFTGTNIGGCGAIGAICGSQKGWGASGVGFGNAVFDVSLSCHEMGHQHGAQHTFNSNTSVCSGAISPSTAYEPGSGSTIMSYAGACDNLQNNRDMFFHAISYDEIVNYTTVGSGSLCGAVDPTGNSAPVVNVPVGGFTIPVNTPFILTGSATDPDGDVMTYSWEQFDLGPSGAPNSPAGNAPIFRSFPPVSSPSRTFPKLSDILNNTSTLGEILPSYSRSLTFRLTARDNRSGGGGVDFAQTSFNVDGASGPFLVTYPNTSTSFCVGNTITVTWNVAGTNIAPVNCTNVNIKLSTDGGLTFPVMLASNTANDGSETITIPDNPVSGNARIKIEAVGNVFFDLSNANFTINKGPVFTTQPVDVNAQWGDNVTFTAIATGFPQPTIQWQVSTNGGADFTDLAGATEGTLNLNCVNLTQNGYKYRVVFTSPCGVVSSDIVTLTVTPRVTAGTISVSPNPQQYSDRISFDVNLVNAVICGEQAATSVTIFIGTQNMGTYPLVVDGSSLKASASNIALLEPVPFGTAPIGQMAPGNRTVTAVFNGVNANFNVSNANTTLTITPEDARVYYTGALFASTSGVNSSTATVTLAATIKDISAVTGDPSFDPYAGDIRNATVTFINRDNNTVIAANVPFGLVSSSDPTIAVATYNWNVNIGTQNSLNFTVGIIIGGYYTRNNSADNTIITVSKPLPNFITGGGFLNLTSSAGTKSGDVGSKNNFGFNVKFNQSGRNLQGSFNTIIRRTEPDGIHIYQIRSNSMTSLSVQTSTVGGNATFNCKANIRDITNPLVAISIDGNASLQVTMTDNGQPGTNDSIAITVWNKTGGLWYSSNWNTTSTIKQLLQGGNLTVNSSNSFSRMQSEESTAISEKPSFLIYPNPADGHVSVLFESSQAGKADVRLIDITGRELYYQMTEVQEGSNLRSYDFSGISVGIYFIVIENNSERMIERLIIQ